MCKLNLLSSCGEYSVKNTRMKFLALAFVLAACNGTRPDTAQTAQGRFAIDIAWPAVAFRTQAIPAETERLRVQIQNQNQTIIQEELTRADANSRRSYTLNIGPKQVHVEAFDTAGQLLARAETQVNIQPNQIVRADLELEPIPSPTAQPSNSPPPSGAPPDRPGPSPAPSIRPSSSPSPEPTPSADPSTSPDPSPSPEASASPSASPNSTDSGGSSGGSSSGSRAQVDSLSVDPETLSGPGLVARLDAVISNASGLQAADYSWSCTPPTGGSCSAPAPNAADPSVAYWTAPDDPNTTTGNVVYTLTLSLPNASRQSVNVTVQEGTGNLTGQNPDFNPGN